MFYNIDKGEYVKFSTNLVSVFLLLRIIIKGHQTHQHIAANSTLKYLNTVSGIISENKVIEYFGT